ncbi:hypothetical protein [Cupriavidus necator]
MFMLPMVADAVLPVGMLCKPDMPPTSAAPTPSIFFKLAQAMTGMLMARTVRLLPAAARSSKCFCQRHLCDERRHGHLRL